MSDRTVNNRKGDAFVCSLLRLAAIASGSGLAIWLIPASVHIVAWFAGPERVAWLPPLWQLCIAIGGCGLAVAAIALGTRPRDGMAAHRLAHGLAPLLILWLWVVPFLPWLPDWAPLVSLLAGPLRWAIAGTAILEVFWSLTSRVRWRLRPATIPAQRVALFALSLSIYLACGLASATAVGPAGDEPHYLVTAHSLLADHDLKIENNHAREDYRAFFAGRLRPDYLALGKDGEIYSVHAPGLPTLLLPAYASAGYRGTVAMMCLLAAFAVLTMFDLGAAFAGPRAALFTSAVVSLSVPFVPHAWLIYPEIPAALLVGRALLWIVRPPQEWSLVWAARGLAFGALPWLHTKYIVLLVVLAPFVVWRAKHRPINILALLLPIALSLVLWMYYFYAIYGVVDPQGPYGAAASELLLQNIPRGVLGLLFDQKFGLLVFSPIYVFAAEGFWLTLQDHEFRFPALAALCAASAFMFSTTRFYMWWGGSSAPARFVVPVLPLLMPFVAVAVSRAQSTLARAATAICVIVGMTAIGVSAVFPGQRLLFSDPHGTGRLTDLLQGAAAWSVTLPTFTEPSWQRPLERLAEWLVAIAVAFGAAALSARLAKSRPVFWTLIVGTLSLTLAAGVLTRKVAASDRSQITLRGQTDLLTAYDGPRLRPFDYKRLTWLEAAGGAGLKAVRIMDIQPFGARGEVAGPMALPAGEYVARVWLSAGARSVHLSVLLADRVTVAEQDMGSADPVEVPFELPVGFDGVSVHADLSEGSHMTRVDVVARRIVPRGARPRDSVRTIESLAGRPGALLIYTNENTYPEGGVFWTRHTEVGTVFVGPAGASSIFIKLHVGAVADVDVEAGGLRTLLHLTPSEDREIVVEVPPGSSLVPLRVQASVSFRPSEIEPPSQDTRQLGCYVRLSLR